MDLAWMDKDDAKEPECRYDQAGISVTVANSASPSYLISGGQYAA